MLCGGGITIDPTLHRPFFFVKGQETKTKNKKAKQCLPDLTHCTRSDRKGRCPKKDRRRAKRNEPPTLSLRREDKEEEGRPQVGVLGKEQEGNHPKDPLGIGSLTLLTLTLIAPL